MNISAMKDDLRQDLIDSGSFLASEVSACDYGILNSCNTCAVMIAPGESEEALAVFGGDTDSEIELTLEIYLPERMDPTDALARRWQVHSVIPLAVQSGSNLDRLNRVVRSFRFSCPRNAFAEFGGQVFIPVYCTVTMGE
jgi:hypothetical protein